jgi:hypothetical protein
MEDGTRLHWKIRNRMWGVKCVHLSALISACASSTMNAFGRHSGIFETSLEFRAAIHRERSSCVLLDVKIKATGTPFLHLSKTISV